MIELGQKVRDRVTGFEGITTARVQYLNGCVQFCVKPRALDGKMLEGEYIDDSNLRLFAMKQSKANQMSNLAALCPTHQLPAMMAINR